jgi:hypothetical protein
LGHRNKTCTQIAQMHAILSTIVLVYICRTTLANIVNARSNDFLLHRREARRGQPPNSHAAHTLRRPRPTCPTLTVALSRGLCSRPRLLQHHVRNGVGSCEEGSFIFYILTISRRAEWTLDIRRGDSSRLCGPRLSLVRLTYYCALDSL